MADQTDDWRPRMKQYQKEWLDEYKVHPDMPYHAALDCVIEEIEDNRQEANQ